MDLFTRFSRFVEMCLVPDDQTGDKYSPHFDCADRR